MFELTESILSVRTQKWESYPTMSVTHDDAKTLYYRGGKLLEATETTLTFGWERFTEGHPIRKAHLVGSAHDIATLRDSLPL